MKKFRYTATNLYGKKYKSSYFVENEEQLRIELCDKNLYLVSCRVISEHFVPSVLSVSALELASFGRQFSIMVESGVSIVDSLSVLKSQKYSSYLTVTLRQVYEDVKSGKLLSQALARHKRVFPSFFVSMVHVGETSGAIDRALCAAADYFESEADIRTKLRSALAYPIALIFMSLALVILMVAFVIPMYQSTLKILDVEMPEMTLAIYNASEWLRSHWHYLIAAVGALVICVLLLKRTEKGRYYIDKLKFYMPIFGRITKSNITARFSRAFSLLTGSGMDIMDAMKEVEIIFGNAYFASKFRKAAEDVRQGMTMALAMENYKLFPSMLIQMLTVGEQTGEIDKVLSKSVKFFEQQVEQSIRTVTGMIQPILLCIIGVAVGMLFYAVYAPILEIMTAFA